MEQHRQQHMSRVAAEPAGHAGQLMQCSGGAGERTCSGERPVQQGPARGSCARSWARRGNNSSSWCATRREQTTGCCACKGNARVPAIGPQSSPAHPVPAAASFRRAHSARPLSCLLQAAPAPADFAAAPAAVLAAVPAAAQAAVSAVLACVPAPACFPAAVPAAVIASLPVAAAAVAVAAPAGTGAALATVPAAPAATPAAASAAVLAGVSAARASWCAWPLTSLSPAEQGRACPLAAAHQRPAAGPPWPWHRAWPAGGSQHVDD